MLKTDNDQVGGQHHNITVTKMSDGRYLAVDAVLRFKIEPQVAATQDLAVSMLKNKLEDYDRSPK